jgi:hypothetical protein
MTYHARRKHRDGDLFRRKETMHAPEPGARTVVVQTFHVRIALALCCNSNTQRYGMSNSKKPVVINKKRSNVSYRVG